MLQPVYKRLRRRPPVWIITVCVFVWALSTGSTGAQEKSKSELYSDRIVAVVNGDVILFSDIKLYEQPFVRNFINLGLQITPPGKSLTYRDVLDKLIVYQLLLQEARKRKITIEDSALDASLQAMAKRNRLSFDEFALFAASKGLNYSDFRDIMRRRYIFDRLIRMEVDRKLVLSEEDAQQFYKDNADKIDDMYKKLLEQSRGAKPKQQKTFEPPTHEDRYIGGKVRLYRISRTLPDGADEKQSKRVLEKAIEIYRSAMTGEDFSKLAKKYSQDVYAASGGDLGWMRYADMVPGMQGLVQRMQVGRVLQPIKAGNEFVIFYLADAKGRRIKKVPIPEKVRKRIRKQWEAQRKAMIERSKRKQSESDPSNKNAQPDKQAQTKNLGILNPDEEKKYRKIRNKVYTILRIEKAQARTKEWIEDLKKSALIDIKL